MLLRDAILKAQKEKRGITRKSFDDLVIYPTNSDGCCLMLDIHNNIRIKSLRWNPSFDDLTADDWEPY